jgi:hypothetical protein
MERTPKNSQKVMVCGAIDVKEEMGFSFFPRVMNGLEYVAILEYNHIIGARK